MTWGSPKKLGRIRFIDRKKTFAFALVVLGVLAVGVGRQLAEGSHALAESDAARGRGEYALAVAAGKRAAEAALPFSPHPAEGYARLADIARDAERRGDDATASAAWRGMRAAVLATHGVGVSNVRWRSMAEDGLVRVAAQRTANGDVSTETTLRASLAEDAAPQTWRYLAVSGVFALLVVAAARLLTRIQIDAQR